MDNHETTTTGSPLLNYEDVSRLTGIPLGTVYAWVSQKRLPHIRLGRKVVRFDRAEILAWLDARRVPVKEA